MQFSTRRKKNGAVLATAVLATWAWLHTYESSLQVPQYLSGWLLLLSTLILLLYGIRKKITTLPLLSNAMWLQLHLYLGLFAIWPCRASK